MIKQLMVTKRDYETLHKLAVRKLDTIFYEPDANELYGCVVEPLSETAHKYFTITSWGFLPDSFELNDEMQRTYTNAKGNLRLILEESILDRRLIIRLFNEFDENKQKRTA